MKDNSIQRSQLELEQYTKKTMNTKVDQLEKNTVENKINIYKIVRSVPTYVYETRPTKYY